MQGLNTVDPFATSGEPSYAQALGSGTVTLSNSSGSYSAPTTFIYDTGGPGALITEGTSITSAGVAPYKSKDGSIANGNTVTFAAPAVSGASSWILNFIEGDDKGSNTTAVASGNATDPGYVNAALNSFFGESVMFDVANGVVGFQSISCFAEGTRIMTDEADIAIEAIRPGDAVITVSGARRIVVWIGHRTVDCSRHPTPESVLPVRIGAHAFGPGLPQRDLYLSPDHALFLDGVLIPVKYLLNGDRVAQLERTRVTYYHLELESHDVVLAEGLPCETYLETKHRSAFANGGTIVAAHPIFVPDVEADRLLQWEALGYAPLVVTGPAVERVRQRMGQGSRVWSPPGRDGSTENSRQAVKA